MNGAQLIYLRDLSNIPPDTQMEPRNNHKVERMLGIGY